MGLRGLADSPGDNMIIVVTEQARGSPGPLFPLAADVQTEVQLSSVSIVNTTGH